MTSGLFQGMTIYDPYKSLDRHFTYDASFKIICLLLSHWDLHWNSVRYVFEYSSGNSKISFFLRWCASISVWLPLRSTTISDLDVVYLRMMSCMILLITICKLIMFIFHDLLIWKWFIFRRILFDFFSWLIWSLKKNWYVLRLENTCFFFFVFLSTPLFHLKIFEWTIGIIIVGSYLFFTGTSFLLTLSLAERLHIQRVRFLTYFVPSSWSVMWL